jgi:CRISPR-associated protein Cmr6
MRPLYNSLASKTLTLGCGHPGLWFEKLYDRWSQDWDLSDKLKLEWIRSVVSKPVGDHCLLDEASARIMKMVDARGGKTGVFHTDSRFVTGLGRSHPIENGFAWHPTLGTPYLPGSSVKGLIRAWAQSEATQNERDLVLESCGELGQAGRVIALDAIPTAPLQLTADVMTPHFHDWSETRPPGDWMSPKPIPFLVTEAKSKFLFSLVPRIPAARDAIERTWSWLLKALELAGAGAKTAVGYGRFSYDHTASEQWRARLLKSAPARQPQVASHALEETSEGRWRLMLEGKSEAEILELVRVHLEKNPLTDPSERAAFVIAPSRQPVCPTSGSRGGSVSTQRK